MRLNEVVYTDAQPVDGYGPGFFRVGGAVVQGAMIAGPAGTQAWQGLEDLAPLLVLQDQIDVLFLGTGADVAHLPDAVMESLQEAGLRVETMSSPAACRTYNVLLSEGRRIALAVLPV